MFATTVNVLGTVPAPVCEKREKLILPKILANKPRLFHAVFICPICKAVLRRDPALWYTRLLCFKCGANHTKYDVMQPFIFKFENGKEQNEKIKL